MKILRDLAPGRTVAVFVALIFACVGPPRFGRPRVYAQYADSVSEHCRYHPEACASAFGPEGGAAASAAAPAASASAGAAATAATTATTAPASADAIVAIGGGILGASIILTEAPRAQEQARIEEVLKQCANQARSSVLKERFNGKSPSPDQCNQVVGVNALGEPILLSMKMGEEMHRAAYRCVDQKLKGFMPNRYSFEQRFRYNPRNGRTTVVTQEEEELLRRHGHGDELRDSIVPDLIIHKGDVRYIQAVYDFKFPCADTNNPPGWREYPNGHPATGPQPTNQGKVYERVLKALVRRVMPGRGGVK